MEKAQPAASENDQPAVTAAVPQPNQRERILQAAMLLLTQGGRDALTTRAVAEAAHVQPPILYRLFTGKAGLLNALAEHGFAVYMAKKRTPVTTEDPVEFLRAGWTLHVQFGITHPELYLLMYADPHPGSSSSAAERSHRTLRDHMRRVAEAGRLRVGEERAAQLFHAAACGTVMTLLGIAEEHRDPSLSETACDAALAAILTDRPLLPAPAVAAAATMLRALVVGAGAAPPSTSVVFTQAEQALLIEWLDRLAQTGTPKP